ncbi:hypothetical protein [Chitinophaga niastensis]|nr:hypothetical protein [Chitinophaga niastensis]
MKQSVLFISIILMSFVSRAVYAQQSDPVTTVKKLFTLISKPNSFINKEDSCYAAMDAMDILKLNKPYIKVYLNNLKNTGLFSSAYLSAQKEYYLDIEKDIKKDGYGTARDADMYTLSQDPPDNKVVLARLQKVTPLISGNAATVTIDFKTSDHYKLIYKLVKENNSWLINSIDATFGK